MQGEILSNRYLVGDQIGVGAMGTVYRATDLRTGGVVVVKVPHHVFTRDPEFLRRLQREARIAASLHSPRVVRVIDLDVHEDIPYLVMEYVAGETLADLLLVRGRFTLAETLTVGREIALALDAAHAAGIVHRDLKPENIKLVEGQVKVLDFGIASATGLVRITAANSFLGTPKYGAPERVEGEGDIRADIYSLGVILFEMLEGHPPFEAAPRALMKLHQTAPPPPLTGDVPETVREIVRRCLAKAPADRYPAPSALVRDLHTAMIAVLRMPPAKNGVAGLRESPAPATPATSPPRAPTVRLPADPTDVAPANGRTGGSSLPRRAALLGIAGVIAAVVLVGAVAALTLATRGSDRPPVDAEAGAAGVLLTEGQQIQLTGQVRVGGVAFGCPGVETLLQLQSIRVEPSGRVVVAYTIEAARVSGIDKCQIFHAVDTDCACVVLETRHADGQVTQSRNTGASGVAAAGATNLYGAGPLVGEWWFDDDVALTGESVSLLRYPPGGDTPAYRILLLGQ